MEDKSNLENLNDNLTHLLIKKIYEEIDPSEIDLDNPFDDRDFIEVIEESIKFFGVAQPGIEDYNYVISLLKKNPNYDYSTKKPTNRIVRPKGHLYEFDYDEDQTHWVRNTYRIPVYSYDADLVFDSFYFYESEGFGSYYDYDVYDSEIYDSETTNSGFDRKSLRKVK